MKKVLLKSSLTLCTMLFVAAPMTGFAADSGENNQCDKTQHSTCTVKNCTIDQEHAANLCNSNLSYNDFYKMYIKCQNGQNCLKGNCVTAKPDAPDMDKPDANKPEGEKPDTNKPEVDQPGVEKPDGTLPDNKPENDGSNNKPDQGQQEENIGSYAKQVADIVNKERAANGLAPLKVNTELSSVATKKAADMRDNQYFSHTSPTYGSPFDMMKQFGISYKAAGENIAKGQKTPEAVMKAWMNSEGHRANILNSNFMEIGIGYVTDGSGTPYWVQMFIRP